jgi:hypothetical protein
MSILILTPKGRLYEIHDAYTMVLGGCIGLVIGAIYLKVRRKRLEKLVSSQDSVSSKDPIQIRGGDLKLEIYSEQYLSILILECIEENENYLVLSQQIKRYIFYKVKEKFTKKSLAISFRTTRFLACQLFLQENPLVVRVANFMLLSKNKSQLIFRFVGSAIIGTTLMIGSLIPYFPLMLIVLFSETEHIGLNCDQHFQKLGKSATQPTEIFVNEPRGQLIITGNNESSQVKIFLPSRPAKIVANGNTTKTVENHYKLSRTKAKQVLFSDFCRKDPQLRLFKNLDEPNLSKKCRPIDTLDDSPDRKVD